MHIRHLTSLVLLVSGFLMPQSLFGHARGENYIFANFQEDSIDGTFEINFNDLRKGLNIEIEGEGEASLQSVRDYASAIQEYIEQNFSIAPLNGEPYTIEWADPGVADNYAQFPFTYQTGPLPDQLAISHQMLYGASRFHRGLLLVQYNAKTDTNYGEEYTAMVFGPSNSDQILDLTDIPGLVTPGEMVAQGVLHIWIGIDHILFLLALIFPTVMLLKENDWHPVPEFRRALWNLLKIVTVFTVAHSFTLLLAAVGILNISSRFVESMIALSIILVALNNITKRVRGGSLWIILFLGLFHGLGFASVMGHLPFRMNTLLKSVIGFNIGVEIGQIAIVLVLFPILFALRRRPIYVPVVLQGGSAVLALVATYWFIQRAFALG